MGKCQFGEFVLASGINPGSPDFKSKGGVGIRSEGGRGGGRGEEEEEPATQRHQMVSGSLSLLNL